MLPTIKMEAEGSFEMSVTNVSNTEKLIILQEKHLLVTNETY